jgi:hypothetical protein
VANSLREAEYVHGQDEEWDADELDDWDGVGVTAGTGGVRTTSHVSYY